MSEAIEKLNRGPACTEKKISEMIEEKKRIYSEIADLLEEKLEEVLESDSLEGVQKEVSTMSEDLELNYLKWIKEQLEDTRKRKSHEMDEETANLYTAVLALIDYLEERGQSLSDGESSENLHLKVDRSKTRCEKYPETRLTNSGEWKC